MLLRWTHFDERASIRAKQSEAGYMKAERSLVVLFRISRVFLGVLPFSSALRKIQ